MSDTEKGASPMVPPNVFHPTENGGVVYACQFTFVDILPLQNGRRVLRMRQRGAEIQMTLSAADAAHIAELLSPGTEAA